MGDYKLTYFNVRALAEPIRFIFAVAEVPYEDIRVEREQWAGMKEKYPWGQLPVLEFDGKQLAQSTAICRYLANKFHLNGSDEWEAARCDELIDALTDLRSEWRKMHMEQDAEKKDQLKKSLIEVHAAKFFGKFNSIQEANGGNFMVGSKVTWVDLTFAHYFEFFESTVDPDILSSYPNLQKLKKAVFELPQIKEWVTKRPVTPF